MEIRSQKRLDVTTAIWCAVGIFLVALTLILKTPGPAMFSILPITFGLGLWLTKSPPLKAILNDDVLTIMEPSHQEIHLSDVQSVSIDGRCQEKNKGIFGAICLNHKSGTVHFPQHLLPRSDKVYDELLNRIPPHGNSPNHEVLIAMAEEARQKFDDDRVWSYSGRERIGRRSAARKNKVFAISLLVTGITWVVAGTILDAVTEGWLATGITLIISGGLWWMFAHSLSTTYARGIKDRKSAGLVITPTEIGLVQGTLKGRMKWNEIRSLTLGGTRRFELTSGIERHSIVLEVEGAKMVIADIYDRPLATIFERLRNNWRPAGD